MTRSTGQREKQRRREELFSAEMTLNRVLLHLKDSASRADRQPDLAEYYAIAEAFARVKLRLLDVMSEQKALR